MEQLAQTIDWDSDYKFRYVGDTPMCTHCHHYNLFIDKTVDDALGSAAGMELRTETAREFYHQMLGDFFEAHAIETTDGRLEAAEELFSSVGHGRLDLSELASDGGVVRGDPLHYSYSWLEKHGDDDRFRPADAVAAGYAAAALARAHGHPVEGVAARETECAVLGDDGCEFELQLQDVDSPEERPRVDRAAIEEMATESFGGLEEDRVEELTGQLREFLAGVSGDERGLIEAFGIFITTGPSSFYNRLSYEMLDRLESRHPSYMEVSAGLLREAGRMCGFNTFGGILGSPEWEAMTGAGQLDMRQVALHSCVIARGLGFGRWSLADYEPGQLMTFRAPCTYEGPYYRLRHGESDSPVCFLFEGACEAIAQLGHAIDWRDVPAFTPEFYDEIFGEDANPWKAEQTRCICTGDDYCEVQVRKRG